MKFRIFLISLVLIPWFASGQSKDSIEVSGFSAPEEIEILKISPDDPRFLEGRYHLMDYLYALVDSTGEQSYSDISSPEYAHLYAPFSKAPLLELTMRRQAFWLRLSIRSDLDHEEIWLTNFMEAEVEAYTNTAGRDIASTRSGLLAPLSARPYKKQYGQVPVLPLTIPTEGYRNYYWRVKPALLLPETDLGTKLNYTLLSPSFLAGFRHVEGVIVALTMGFAIAVGFYHLIIFFYNKEITYLWFALYCLACPIVGLIETGYALQFFWPEIPSIHYLPMRDGILVVLYLILILFSRSYLHIPKLAPAWDKVLWVILGAIALGFLIGIFFFFLHLSPVVQFVLMQIAMNAQILLAVVLLIIPILCIRRGYQPARFYLLASSAYLIGIILTMLNVINVLHVREQVDWVMLGWVVQMSFFALGLAQLFKSLQGEKFEAERLRELDHVKTRLYANITHEFRTPITVILGMAEQVRDNPQDWFREGLRMITRNGKNLLNLVNQMLDLAKLEAGSLKANMVQGDVINYLQYLTESFHSFAETKGVNLHFSSSEEVFYMDYDPEKLLQIVSNLLSNAIKFTPEGGSVDVSAMALDNSLQVKVKDTGVGIPADKLPHIFDRFYQVEDDEQRHAGGTGIGLTLTRELVKLLNGKIDVESKPGVGTEFTVLLPITREAELTSEPQAVFPAVEPDISGDFATAATATKNLPLLLIVEDNADVVLYLKSLLANDYQLEVAANGEEGWDKALKLVPDIIISDVMMPVMDGFELCDKLKKDMRTSHIPIIMLTAKADISSKIEGLERGADAYLSKPFNKEELRVRLEKLVELRKQLQARYGSLEPLVPSEDIRVQMEDAFMVKLHGLLETHFSEENFGVPDLCRELLMSRAQLYRKVAALTGQPAAAYIRSFRLQKAKTLLQTTTLTVSEVAFEVGFKDLGHFSRTFRKAFGQSPSDFRR